MKEISLTQDKVALVDNADYIELSKYKWFAQKQSKGNFYAVRTSSRKNGKHFAIAMHRQILGLKRGDPRQADHLNHNTLDNCLNNLRICTCQQNHFNQMSHPNSSSRFKGVTWSKRVRKWVAQINIKGKMKHLGYWDIEEVAALRYDMVAIREYGEFAYLNFN